ncbi:MAG: amidase family protein, partial [bacterium]
LGHTVEESHPEGLDDPSGVMQFVGVIAANIARVLDVTAERLGRPLVPGDVEPLTWAVAERGRAMTVTDYLTAIEFVHGFGRRLATWWQGGFDLLLTPTTGAPPPPLGYLSSTPDEPLRAFMRSAPYGAYTSAFNLSGQPAISLPLHLTKDGLPIGTQLVAAYGREDLLLQVAAQVEAAAPWQHRESNP